MRIIFFPTSTPENPVAFTLIFNFHSYENLLDLPKLTFKKIDDSFSQVSETENLRKNLAVERMIVEGCDIILDVNQVFVRQGESNSQIKTRAILFLVLGIKLQNSGKA